MNFILVTVLALSSTDAFAQDFSGVTSNTGFRSGEMLGKLETCNASPKSVIRFQESIDKMKKDALPARSHAAYAALFDESFAKGRESALSSPMTDKSDCNKIIEDANTIVSYNEKTSYPSHELK